MAGDRHHPCSFQSSLPTAILFARAVVVALTLMLAHVTLAAPPVLAQRTTSPVFERFDVQIDILPNGDFTVAETQVVRFGPRTARHGVRAIPLDRVTEIEDVSVTSSDVIGRDTLRYEVARRGDSLVVDWYFPPTANQTRTFVLRYRVVGGLRYYADGDQLYWDAIYADRALPIERADVTARLPRPVAPDQVQLAAYPERLRIATDFVDGQSATFRVTSLPPQTGLTVRFQFPHGVVAGAPPSWQQDADQRDYWNDTLRPVANFLLGIVALLIPVGGALGILYVWRTRGRDPRVANLATVLTEPPAARPPGVAGTLVDERADVQDVVATLVDLAERGVLRLRETTVSDLAGSDHDFEIELLAPDLTSLRPFEQTIVREVLPGGRPVRFSQIAPRFELAIPHVRDALYAEVVQLRLFEQDPEHVRDYYRRVGWLLVAAGLLLAFFVGAALGDALDLAWAPFASLALVGFGVTVVAPHMPRRTRAGADEAIRWRAFRDYLATIERQLDLAANRDTFERYLPYAVAFGIDRAWVQKFASVGTPAPRWYRRGGPPIVVMPGPYIGPTFPHPGGWGGPRGPAYRPGPSRGDTAPAGGGGDLSDWSGAGAGGLQDVSDSLAEMLSRASDVMARGGGSGWSGGGGGSFGGGGGGGSGGFD